MRVLLAAIVTTSLLVAHANRRPDEEPVEETAIFLDGDVGQRPAAYTPPRSHPQRHATKAPSWALLPSTTAVVATPLVERIELAPGARSVFRGVARHAARGPPLA